LPAFCLRATEPPLEPSKSAFTEQWNPSMFPFWMESFWSSLPQFLILLAASIVAMRATIPQR
jgi:hypothetical protein